MSEDSVKLEIEMEDANRAQNRDNVGESGEKMSELEEFLQIWRSHVHVTIAFFQHLQYRYLNDLLSKRNLSNFAFENSEKYIKYSKSITYISYLRNELPILEKEQRNKCKTYSTDLEKLLEDVSNEKITILTAIPPVPEMDFQESVTIIKNKTDDKFQSVFHNLLHFYIIIYDEELLNWNVLEKFKMLFENISKRREEFDGFITNIVMNQDECNEEVLQRWEELQQFLTNDFNDTQTDLQPNESIYAKIAEPTSKFYLFLQSLMQEDGLKWTKKIHQLLKDKRRQINNLYNLRNSFKVIENHIEQLFLILLLDIKFDFKNFIKAHEATIQISLNSNFLKQWRRMLHMPITLLHFQQYQVYCGNLKENESAQWKCEKTKVTTTYCDMNKRIAVYVNNILKRMEILKHTSIILEPDQLIEDSEYLTNLLRELQEINYIKIDILRSLPPIPKLNLIDSGHSSTSEAESGLNDIIFDLYHFYKLVNENSTIGFSEWNKEMLENIQRNVDQLNNFICNYIQNQHDEKDVLLVWEEFKTLLSQNDNVMNKEVEENNQFAVLNRLVFDRHCQREVESQSIFPINFERTVVYDKMHELQIYLILLLNITFDAKVFFISSINLESSAIINGIKIIFQLIIRDFKYVKICSIILKSYVNVNEMIRIANYMQILKMKCDEDAFEIYNKLLTQFQNILQNEDKLYSIEILQEIETMHESISNLNIGKDNSDKQKIICNFYCIWRKFIKEADCSKEKFFQWNQEMFHLCYLKLNEIDLIINRFANEDQNIVEMWNRLKNFLIKKYTGHQDENPDEILADNVYFESFLNDNSSFPDEMEILLNSISIYDLDMEVSEPEILYILTLLDSSFSLKQMAHFICEYNMLITYNKLNYEKFICFTMITDLNKYNLNFFDFFQYELLNEEMNKYLNAYKSLNKEDLNIMDSLKEIKKYESDNDFLYLDKVPQSPTDDSQLTMISTLFLIKYRQIFYLYFYFVRTQINGLQEIGVAEKIQTMLKYIYMNYGKMDEFINNYFGDLEV